MGTKNVFQVKGSSTFLNDKPFLAKGLRCSNALFSAESTDELIKNLEGYTRYGLNMISVFLMGNRYGDIKGYNEDASLNSVYADRLAKIIEAADDLGMVVLVGCLYWSTSDAKWDSWTQDEANLAVANTVQWLKDKKYKNVFVDVDNEGMAQAQAGFSVEQMILAAKEVDPSCIVASNFIGTPPESADLSVHFGDIVDDKPYIESEGVPGNAPGGYWGAWTKKYDPRNK